MSVVKLDLVQIHLYPWRAEFRTNFTSQFKEIRNLNPFVWEYYLIKKQIAALQSLIQIFSLQMET